MDCGPNTRQSAAGWPTPGARDSNRFFLKCCPIVWGCFETGKLRVQTGAMSFRCTFTTLSQKGNIAHSRWKNAGRIPLLAARDPKLSRAHLGAVARPD